MLNPKQIMYLTPTDLLSNGFDSFVCKTSWKTWNNLLLKMEKLLVLVNTELTHEKQTLLYVMLHVTEARSCKRKWRVKWPFIPVLPPALPSFIHLTTSYKDKSSAEKCWVSFQRSILCLHWLGKPDKIFFIILLSHWHQIWSQTGWVIEKLPFKSFNKEEKVLHLTPISSCLHLFILNLR